MDNNLPTNVDEQKEPGKLVEPPKKKIGKKWWLALVAILVLLGLGWWLWVANQNTQSSKQSQTNNETQEIVPAIESFQDCVDGGFAINKDDNSCTASDGVTYYADGNAEETLPPPTDSVGSQSMRLCVVDCVDGLMTSGRLLYLESGESKLDINATLETTGIDVGSCTVMLEFKPDKPTQQAYSHTFTAKVLQTLSLEDGLNTISAKCPASDGSLLSAQTDIIIGDRLPELCDNFNYSAPAQSSAANLSDLQSDIVGTWVGCVENPWWATYYVTITFGSNASYNAYSTEVLDGNISKGGFYDYDIAGVNNSKIYGITSYQNGLGQGFIDMVSPNGESVKRGDLRNIKLADGKLTFDFYHRAQYGPVRFMLNKQ